MWSFKGTNPETHQSPITNQDVLFPKRSAKMWRRESADSSEFDFMSQKNPKSEDVFGIARSLHNRRCMSQARGTQHFLLPSSRASHSFRASLIKRLLCRVHRRSRVIRNSCNSGRFIYENTKWYSTQSMGRKIRSRAKILYSWINVKRPFRNRSLLMQSWIPIDINIHSDWGKRLTGGAYIFACVFNGIQGHCQAKIWDNTCSVSFH